MSVKFKKERKKEQIKNSKNKDSKLKITALNYKKVNTIKKKKKKIKP